MKKFILIRGFEEDSNDDGGNTYTLVHRNPIPLTDMPERSLESLKRIEKVKLLEFLVDQLDIQQEITDSDEDGFSIKTEIIF
jgi:hypothetical protein